MVIKKIRNILSISVDLIFPRNDLHKKVDSLTVESMFSLLPKTIHQDKNIIPIFDYSNELTKQSVWSLKFRGKRNLAKIFAHILYDELLENLAEEEIFSNFVNPILIPIPLSKNKLKERGFNQAELIAREMNILDNNTSFTFEKNLLFKIKDTPPQSRAKNKRERLENLKDCFDIRQSQKIKNRNIILIDDVTTTGATLSEAKKTLKKYGARKIIAITVAH